MSVIKIAYRPNGTYYRFRDPLYPFITYRLSNEKVDDSGMHVRIEMIFSHKDADVKQVSGTVHLDVYVHGRPPVPGPVSLCQTIAPFQKNVHYSINNGYLVNTALLDALGTVNNTDTIIVCIMHRTVPTILMSNVDEQDTESD